jgi:Domain of unknown function (DUF927)
MAGSVGPVTTFFSIVAPWQTATYINVHAFFFDPQLNKLVPKASRAARDQSEAVSFATWCSTMGWDVYACLSSQRTPGVGKLDKRGHSLYRALRGLANSVALKAFFVDIDVKEGAYKTTQDAVQALQEFIGTTGLPRPTMLVYSGGGGFHAYWVLEETIPLDAWRPLAGKLAEACRIHGVLADHSVTVNAAQILRIPGTLNNKYGAPRPVTHQIVGPSIPVETLKKVLDNYSPAAPGNSGSSGNGSYTNDSFDMSKFPGKGPPVDMGRFLAGVSPDPYTLEEVAKGCPWIEETLRTHGKGQKEPLWFTAAHVAIFTDGGLEDFISLSDGHENYSLAATEEKFARVLNDKTDKNRGWPRCASIETAGSTWCAGCDHKKLNKSPLNFAVRKTPEVTPPGNPQASGENGYKLEKREVSIVPGYLHNPDNGMLTAEVLDKRTGQTIPIEVMSCPVWNLDFKRDQFNRYAIHFDTQMAQEEPVHITVPSGEERNGDTLRGCLVGKYSLPLKPGEEKGILIFMAAFKDRMRETRNVIDRQELMGWSEEGGKPVAFIYGPTRFNCNGNTAFNQPDTWIRDRYFPTGSAEPWTAAMAMLNAELRPEMDLLAATAFAAPLMRFTSEKGVVISAFSSGTAAHKTTAIKVGQATWGSFKGINQLTDTLNSVIEIVGKTRIVATYYDEMKSSTDIKRFASMLYTFTGGKGKGRLGRNAELKDVSTWDSLLVGVSNDSLFDHIAQHDKSTDAGVVRIFEFEITAPLPGTPGQIDMGLAGEILKKLEYNYGHAGTKFAELLGKSVDTLQRRVTDKVIQLQDELKAPSAERFWVAAAAVLLLGAQMANDINLARFDVGRMRDFIGVTFDKMRGAKISSDLDVSKAHSLREILASFINTHRREIMATDIAGARGQVGRINPVAVLNLADIQHVNEFSMRYVQTTDTMMFSKPALTAWLIEKRLPAGVIIKNMMTLYNGVESVRNITSGTGRGGAKGRVIELDLKHPSLTGLYEVP